MTSLPGLSLIEALFYGGQEDFLDGVFFHMPPSTRFKLARTSKSFARLVRDFHGRLWNPDEFLAEWVDDPIAFRAKLGQCDALICGWEVLRFLDPTLLNLQSVGVPNMEICLRMDGLMALGCFLQKEGYNLEPILNDIAKFEHRVKKMVRSRIATTEKARLPYEYSKSDEYMTRMTFERNLSGGDTHDARKIDLVVVRI